MLTTRKTGPLDSTIPPKRIDIYFEKSESGLISTQDKNNACMNAAIVSFNMGVIGSTYNPGFYINGMQAMFHLANFDSLELNVVCETPVTEPLDKEEIITSLAAEALLKILHTHDCVQKEVVTFQSRKGRHGDANFHLSPLSFIFLNENTTGGITLDFKKGLISHTYAYLYEKRLCLFFNPLTQAQETKIKSIFSGLFKEHLPEAPALDQKSKSITQQP